MKIELEKEDVEKLLVAVKVSCISPLADFTRTDVYARIRGVISRSEQENKSPNINAMDALFLDKEIKDFKKGIDNLVKILEANRLEFESRLSKLEDRLSPVNCASNEAQVEKKEIRFLKVTNPTECPGFNYGTCRCGVVTFPMGVRTDSKFPGDCPLKNEVLS